MELNCVLISLYWFTLWIIILSQMFFFSFHIKIYLFLVFISHSWLWNSFEWSSSNIKDNWKYTPSFRKKKKKLEEFWQFDTFTTVVKDLVLKRLHCWLPEDDLYIALLQSLFVLGFVLFSGKKSNYCKTGLAQPLALMELMGAFWINISSR